MKRWYLAVALATAFLPEARAQIVILSRSVIVPAPVVVVPSRVTIKVLVSESKLSTRPLLVNRDVDLSGVNLDVVGPEAIWPDRKRNVIPIPPPQDKRPLDRIEPKKLEMPKADPPKPEPPKKDPPAKVLPPPPPKPPNLDIPKAEPLEECRRLMALGLRAFSAQEFGLAAWRFRQAGEVEPSQALPYFLLAQASMAVGKYKDAVTAIENGLRRQPDWPLSAFAPRADLYQGTEELWDVHKKQLAGVQALQPNEPAYLILKAYVWWFDGQRDEAAMMFERAKSLAPGNLVVEAFLKPTPKLAFVP